MKNLLLYLLVFVLAACNNNKQNDNSNADTSKTQPDTLVKINDDAIKLDTSDVSFFQNAAYGGMVEVEASKRILTLTENSSVKAFAQMMVKDHGDANQKLKVLAESKGYELPTSLPNSNLALVNKMNDFKDEGRNEFYLQMMINEHANAINHFSLASRSQDQDINRFAKQTLPILKLHHKEVIKIDSLYKLPKANQGDDPLKISDRSKSPSN